MIRRLDRSARYLAIAVAVACLPLIVSTAQGENGGIIALGLILCLLTLTRTDERSRSNLPALAAGILLLSLKPQFLLVPVVLLLVRHRRREVAAAGATLAAVLIAGLAAGGIPAYQACLRVLGQGFKSGGQFHWGPAFNYTFGSQAQAVLGQNLLTTLATIGAAVVVVGAVALLARNGGKGTWLFLGSAAILATTHAMYHDLALLFPLLAVSMGMPRVRWAALAVLMSILIDPIVYPATHVHLVVLALVSAVVLTARGQVAGPVRTMVGYLLGVLHSGSWKSFAPPRWGSASGSETP